MSKEKVDFAITRIRSGAGYSFEWRGQRRCAPKAATAGRFKRAANWTVDATAQASVDGIYTAGEATCNDFVQPFEWTGDSLFRNGPCLVKGEWAVFQLPF
jgi:hypothetical protein